VRRVATVALAANLLKTSTYHCSGFLRLSFLQQYL
jgi:hypothetical protein